ncbi:MAG: hypothetical protein EXR74_03415 [Bdellovibrionales bacterium]|nr:hypothetical protein [Bdellovibrionales bacterium]
MKRGLVLFLGFLLTTNIKAQEPAKFFSEVRSSDSNEKTLKITHDNSAPWKLEDSICVTRDKKDIACGIVIATDTQLATVQISFEAEEMLRDEISNETGDHLQLTFNFPFPEKGDAVRLVDRNPKLNIRQLASELRVIDSFKETGATSSNTATSTPYNHLKTTKSFLPTSNLTVGFNLIFPTLEYQQSFSDHSAVGVMPLFMNYSVGEGSLKGTGCFFNYHYYTEDPFNGYWGKTGLGIYGLTASYNGIEDSNIAPAIGASFGRRFFKNKNLNFGFAVGGQYLFASTNTGLPFSGFIPSLIVDIGFAF